MKHAFVQSKRLISAHIRRGLATALAMTVLLSPVLDATAWGAREQNPIQIRGGISVGVNGDEVIPSLSFREASIKDVLYGLSEQGNFNLLVDDAVEGTISLDLKDTSINKALEYIMTLSQLTYYRDGNTLIVTTTDGAEEKALNKLMLKSLPVKYSNATDLATVLNDTIFSVNRPGGNTKAVATADARTNSILVMGNDTDVSLAARALEELDFPLQHKTFFLKNAPAMQVANTLAQTLFNVTLSMSSSSGGSSSSASGASSSSSGSSGGSSSSSSSGGSASGGSSSGGSSGGAAGGNAVQVMKGGPVTFITNAVNNTLTLIGTAEQIDLAESMLYDVDVRPAQVAIQVSVIQLKETKNKSLTTSVNPNASGTSGLAYRYLGLGLNFSSSTTAFSWANGAGRPTISKLLENLNLSASLTGNKTKILANPTILAVSGTNSKIDVTEEVYAGASVTTDPTTGNTTTSPIIKNAGITLDITPEVFNDGTVSLKMQPTVSQPSDGPVLDGSDEPISLMLTNTLTIAQARVKDGESLILGGLIREQSDTSFAKVPFLSNLPIVGALFRPSQTNDNVRTETIIVVTPHIIKEDGVPYFRQDWKNKVSYTQGSEPSSVAAYKTPETTNAIVPTANMPGGYGPQAVQTLESHGPASNFSPSAKPGGFPLASFGEVLK